MMAVLRDVAVRSHVVSSSHHTFNSHFKDELLHDILYSANSDEESWITSNESLSSTLFKFESENKRMPLSIEIAIMLFILIEFGCNL
jgi:uncharacterized protein YfeS